MSQIQDDSNDKLETLLGEDSSSDIEFTLKRPRKYFINDSDSDTCESCFNLKKDLNVHIASVHEGK